MENKISELYGISFNISDISSEDECSMHAWYGDLINKTYVQIDLFDVTRMIIQEMFLELAVPKAIEFLKDTPFCGQRYEGELIELLSKMDISYFDNYKDEMQKILCKASGENKTYEWLCEEERREFFELIDSFRLKLFKSTY